MKIFELILNYLITLILIPLSLVYYYFYMMPLLADNIFGIFLHLLFSTMFLVATIFYSIDKDNLMKYGVFHKPEEVKEDE